MLGLRFCARAFSSCGEWGPLFITVRGPLTIAASPVAEHRLQTRRLSNCGSRAQLLRGTWDLPRPGLEPVSPALAGGFSTTALPGKPQTPVLILLFHPVWTVFLGKGIKTCQAGQGLKGIGQKRFIRGRLVSTVSQGMTGKDKWASLDCLGNKKNSPAWKNSFPKF